MFSDDQMKKIKYFASVTKIANECFKVCVSFDDSALSTQKSDKLSLTEVSCLRNCSEEYLKLRDFIEIQLFNDYESIQNKNKKIMEDET